MKIQKNKLQKIIDYINNIANKDIRPIIYVEDDNDSGIFEPYMYYSNSIQSGNTSNKVIRFRSLQPKELEKSPSTVNTKAVGFMVTLGVAEFEIVYSKSSNEVVSVNADNIVTITNSGIDLPMLRTDNTANESDIIDGSNDTLRFTPTYDYQPATKKYVDDNVKTVSDKVTTLESKNVAELDENGKIPTSQLPSYVDDVLEFENKAAFPTTGETGKIYVAKDTNLTWRWSGTDYVEISPSLALGETSSTAFRGDYGKLAYTHAVTNKGIEQATKGLYKFKTNAEGHIIETEAVTKQDILNLGINSDYSTKYWNGKSTEEVPDPNVDLWYDWMAEAMQGNTIRIRSSVEGFIFDFILTKELLEKYSTTDGVKFKLTSTTIHTINNMQFTASVDINNPTYGNVSTSKIQVEQLKSNISFINRVISNITVNSSEILQLDTRGLDISSEDILFIFLNGEKLIPDDDAGVIDCNHYIRIIENGHITGIQLTNDWNIVDTDIIEVVTTGKETAV